MWDFDKFGDNIAVITESGDKISYSMLGEYCSALTGSISRRCLVFNLCKNELGSLVGYAGFLNAGIIPLMLKSDLDEGLLQDLIQRYKPDYIYVPANMIERFASYKAVYENLGYALLKTGFENVYPLNDDLALLLTTSGSTGSPKLVRQSYRNIEANTASIVQFLGLTASERVITTLPMNYTYGISIINTHLAVGATIILTDKALMQKEFWLQMKDFEATSFGGVPYTFEMLNRLRFERMNLPALRYVTQAGGKLSTALHEKFAKWAEGAGKKFVVMYGQTEATARMSYLPAEKALEKCGSIGITVPGGRFSLVAEDGREVATADTQGELVFYGDNVTLGYAECGEDLIKGDERNGRLETGDIAKFDNEGFYYIVGRKKRFLKIWGNRINLDETERLLNTEFSGCDFACAGVDDKMAVFITNESFKDKVLSYLTEMLKFHATAFKICFIDTIPRNESGKVLYKELPEGV
ncbi:Acyl-CoA synthetase (AMP-forming)/AMP-acid ligase II [Fibrobacter sp. UWH9]|uniref:AMP-binding protein n=1 Tax=Fibrobacter sp. UWH9 TaxID=1896213 RepID=UPI000910B654|nr:AMP-binding protein [Fibrobacter sp. UWH9]SHG33000.1 Acyl-CoA synthetase (AMP-forming)/AMP-acid ligase II [Fibrobacter sp. UWH9]